MSAAVSERIPAPPRSRRYRTVAVLCFALAIAAVWLFAAGAGAAEARFVLNLGRAQALEIPDLVLPVGVTAYLLAVVCAALGGTLLVRAPRLEPRVADRRTLTVLAVAVGLFLFAFLTWSARDASLNLVGMLQSTMLRAIPIALGAVAGILSERAGVINIAIEGQFLLAAFVGAVAGSALGTAPGLVAGVLAGALVGALLAVLSIRYRADQIIVGVVLDVLALGLTGFLTAQLLASNPHLNAPAIVRPVAIPGLARLPVVGPILFDTSPFVYATLVLVVVVQWGLFRTRWGLRVRAVGEHPRAADTAGLSVPATRYRQVLLGGLVAGLGGAYFTLGSVGSFGDNMTAGRGFIALAAVIVGRWHPVGALLAALVFGFADALQASLAILRTSVPSEFLLMAPYVATILVVAGAVGRVRPPAAGGKPYVKE